MGITEFLNNSLLEKLDKYRVVVWYDGKHEFKDFIDKFTAPNCVVINATKSIIIARREAEQVFKKMNNSAFYNESQKNMIIYLPFFPPKTLEEELDNQFELFSRVGTVFGKAESERLNSIARQVWPEKSEQIDTLFREGRPTLDLLETIPKTKSWPLIEQIILSQSVSEVIPTILCDEELSFKFSSMDGAREELNRFVGQQLGFSGYSHSDWETYKNELASYILLSEFSFDVCSDLSIYYNSMKLASDSYKNIIYKICDNMRGAEKYRDKYIVYATTIEEKYKLENIPDLVNDIGERDTFAFEEVLYLKKVINQIKELNINHAKSMMHLQKSSFWKNRAERDQVWNVVERGLNILEIGETISNESKLKNVKLLDIVKAYTKKDGGYKLDEAQRLFEQSVAECTRIDEVLEIVEICRRKYTAIVEPIQEKFLSLLSEGQWPPEGFLKQTEIFDRFVHEHLQRREKVAYFLGDSLRFEMGISLAETLASIAQVEVHSAACVVPTTTMFGMAALMPGASSDLNYQIDEGCLTPCLGNRKMKASIDRMKYIKEKYGDRFSDITLGELLSIPSNKTNSSLEKADLLVIRVSDMDLMPENLSLYHARKNMTTMLGDFYQASVKLIDAGFDVIVLTADHGHIMLPEILPGDILPTPKGNWILSKRRCFIGYPYSKETGTVVLKSQCLGLDSSVGETCIPRSFKVFNKAQGYAHEGISLQESIVPIIKLRSNGKTRTQSKNENVTISYKRNFFTNRVFSINICFDSLIPSNLRTKVDVYDGTDKDCKVIGTVADCPSRDETTHEVILNSGCPVHIPILIDSDFNGDYIEIRVIDSTSKVIWTRLKLKNELLE
ncbi:PglZ domain-containing protein [Desnuesiella massiliensis]|uniref:PglZ domain-containing protein n=1 Tax=Desnuesiella massiliensis TaxID=1650662 RepID=UPI0006E33B4F|nr:PglZ domain-containing protein [Desnuesiella massiliensis]